MTAVLGISAFYHDSATCLVVDGELVAAAQEERFTRKKHDPAFPSHAARFCLDEAGLDEAVGDVADRGPGDTGQLCQLGPRQRTMVAEGLEHARAVDVTDPARGQERSPR